MSRRGLGRRESWRGGASPGLWGPELTFQRAEASHLLGHQQPQLVAAVGLPDLLAAVLGLGAGQGGDGLLARDVALGGLVILDLRGAAPAFPGVGLSGGLLPTAAVPCGSLAGLQHLVGTFAQEGVPLPLLLLQLPFQKLLLPAQGLPRQLRLVLLLLSPRGEVAVVHVLKIFGDRVLVVAVCPHFLFGPVREVAVLEEVGKRQGRETLLSEHTMQAGPRREGGTEVWKSAPWFQSPPLPRAYLQARLFSLDLSFPSWKHEMLQLERKASAGPKVLCL